MAQESAQKAESRISGAKTEFTAKNGDISNWDVRNVQNMYLMFNGTPLAKNTPKWYKN